MGERASGQWLILDRRGIILAAKTIDGLAEQNLGRCLWDIYPEAERLYERAFAEAWEDGRAEALVFHMGRLIRATMRRTRAGLKISYKAIAEIETVTLQALQASLDQIEGLADDDLARARARDRVSRPCARPAPKELRLLPPIQTRD